MEHKIWREGKGYQITFLVLNHPFLLSNCDRLGKVRGLRLAECDTQGMLLRVWTLDGKIFVKPHRTENR